jgi:hypothetical protein
MVHPFCLVNDQFAETIPSRSPKSLKKSRIYVAGLVRTRRCDAGRRAVGKNKSSKILP